MTRKRRRKGKDASSPPSEGRSRFAPFVVGLITFVVFLPALRNGFVSFDDHLNFVDNVAFRGLGPEQLAWMWSTFHGGHFVPLTWMSHGLEFEMWGLNPVGYHLTNIVLHAGVAGLAYLLSDRVLRAAGAVSEEQVGLSRYLPAAFAALAFSIHPLRVESVAWITERRDVLSLLFELGSILAYWSYATSSNNRLRAYVASVALFACALLSKATVMTLPAVLLILDAYPLRRMGAGQRLRVLYEKLPFVALSLAAALTSVNALPARPQLSFLGKSAVSLYSLSFYLVKSVVPIRLSALYPLPVEIQPFALRYSLSALVVAGITGLLIALRKRAPGLLAAWLAFVIVTLPMAGIVQNGPQITADRYTYHSSLALTLAAAAGIAWLLANHRNIAVILSATLLVVWSGMTMRQTTVWRDSITLWARAVDVDPDSPLAENGLGEAIENDSTVAEAMRPQRMAEAIGHFRRAIAIDPTYYDAHNNLGTALAMTGAPREAITHFADALRLNPKLETAHYNWGNALNAMGDLAGAAEQYRAAIAINPADADAAYNLGVVTQALRAKQGAPAR